ncbi:META domain-containing protein [Flavobacterium sp. N1994]|uniref:META domain-containing protein n=1 Tax=Flavobacterium sp. N1994 TaxID=2986827 RepID=UPI002222D57A|nr:META domain-containing protein [Flavobacterium sp. N1994]
MRNIYFTVAILFLGFTSCKNNEATEVENTNDSIAVEQNRVEAKDTASSDVTSTESDSSDVNLPNKMSTSTSTNTTDPSKGKFALAETKWKLVELNGKAVESPNKKEYYINFDSKSGKFEAFAGCNTIKGTFFMKAANKLGFSKIVGTKKACDAMDFENDFIKTIQMTDNYMIEEKGTMLHFHNGKKAIAKFKAIK